MTLLGAMKDLIGAWTGTAIESTWQHNDFICPTGCALHFPGRRWQIDESGAGRWV